MGLQAGTENLGTAVSVRGSVLDVRFDRHLPAIYSVLRTGMNQEITIEVLVQTDRNHVRGIALTPTQGLARGMAAMQRADKKIGDSLETLNATFHRVRQSGIDEELFDVVSGFEALTAKDGNHV